MAQEPASIRYKNPGAMWGNALAIKWGAQKKAVTLNDGKGQNNNIAVFPTYVQGICAQLDLWRTRPSYRNKRFADAIAIWSGHNEVESYIAFVLKRVPSMTRSTVMNDAFWQSPSGIAFLKAQAWHEAGKRYPAPDDDWKEAQRRVFGLSEEPPAEAPDPDPVAPEAGPAPESKPPSILDKVVPIARTIAGGAFGTAAAGGVASTVAENPNEVAEKVTSVVTKSDQVIAATKQVVAVPKPGFWNGLLSFVSSPGFLVSMIVVMGVMWFLVWFIQKQHQQAASK